MPFAIDDADILHHTPFNPMIYGFDNIYASGTLIPVNTIPITDGIPVFDKPLNNPAVVISKHINN